MPARRGLLAPQNTFLDTIATRFDGTHSNFVLGNAKIASVFPIVYCSDGFCELTGYSRAQIMQKSCACNFLYGQKTDVQHRDSITRALESKQELKLEVIMYKSSGTPFWCLLDIVPIQDEKHEVVLFLCSHKDITKQKLQGQKHQQHLLHIQQQQQQQLAHQQQQQHVHLDTQTGDSTCNQTGGHVMSAAKASAAIALSSSNGQQQQHLDEATSHGHLTSLQANSHLHLMSQPTSSWPQLVNGENQNNDKMISGNSSTTMMIGANYSRRNSLEHQATMGAPMGTTTTTNATTTTTVVVNDNNNNDNDDNDLLLDLDEFGLTDQELNQTDELEFEAGDNSDSEDQDKHTANQYSRRRSRAVLYQLSGHYGSGRRSVNMKSKLKLNNRMNIPEYKTTTIEKQRFILLHYGLMKTIWDWIILIVTFYVAIVVPYNATFKPVFVDTKNKVLPSAQEDCKIDTMDMIVEAIFLVDVFLNLRTTYVNRKGEVVTKPKTIMRHYLRTWFIVDTCAALPIDVLCGRFQSRVDLNLVKLIRLLRLARLLQKMDRYSQYSYIILTMLMLIFSLLAHWCACIWYVIAISEIEHNPPDWKIGWLHQLSDKLGYSVVNATDMASSYVTALYFTTSSLTSVGFGNVSANTNTEKIFSIVIMLIGALMHAVVFGNVTALIRVMYARRSNYQTRLRDLKDFFRLHQVPKELQQRMNDYFQTTWSLNHGIETYEILRDFPEELRGDVSLHLHREVLSLPIFETAPQGFLKSLARHIESKFCCPTEYLIHRGDALNYLYLVCNGSMEVLQDNMVVAILGKGDLVGYDVSASLTPEHTHQFGLASKSSGHLNQLVKSSSDLKALTYCDLKCIHISGLLEVLKLYPEFSDTFHKEIIHDLSFNLREPTLHDDLQPTMGSTSLLATSGRGQGAAAAAEHQLQAGLDTTKTTTYDERESAPSIGARRRRANNELFDPEEDGGSKNEEDDDDGDDDEEVDDEDEDEDDDDGDDDEDPSSRPHFDHLFNSMGGSKNRSRSRKSCYVGSRRRRRPSRSTRPGTTSGGEADPEVEDDEDEPNSVEETDELDEEEEEDEEEEDEDENDDDDEEDDENDDNGEPADDDQGAGNARDPEQRDQSQSQKPSQEAKDDQGSGSGNPPQPPPARQDVASSGTEANQQRSITRQSSPIGLSGFSQAAAGVALVAMRANDEKITTANNTTTTQITTDINNNNNSASLLTSSLRTALPAGGKRPLGPKKPPLSFDLSRNTTAIVDRRRRSAGCIMRPPASFCPNPQQAPPVAGSKSGQAGRQRRRLEAAHSSSLLHLSNHNNNSPPQHQPQLKQPQQPQPQQHPPQAAESSRTGSESSSVRARKAAKEGGECPTRVHRFRESVSLRSTETSSLEDRISGISSSLHEIRREMGHFHATLASLQSLLSSGPHQLAGKSSSRSQLASSKSTSGASQRSGGKQRKVNQQHQQVPVAANDQTGKPMTNGLYDMARSISMELVTSSSMLARSQSSGSLHRPLGCRKRSVGRWPSIPDETEEAELVASQHHTVSLQSSIHNGPFAGAQLKSNNLDQTNLTDSTSSSSLSSKPPTSGRKPHTNLSEMLSHRQHQQLTSHHNHQTQFVNQNVAASKPGGEHDTSKLHKTSGPIEGPASESPSASVIVNASNCAFKTQANANASSLWTNPAAGSQV